MLLVIGAVGTLAGVLQRCGAPVPYVCGEWLLILLFLAAAVAGASLTWQDDHRRTAWTPARPGRRFGSAVLYSRAGCHLCDDARELLTEYAAYLPEAVVIDVDEDPALREEFDACVPVVAFDGQIRFRGRISEPMLRRLIEGTPPIEDA